MPKNDVDYKLRKPDSSLSDFVESFWMLANPSDQEKKVVVLPDGRIDIFFSYSSTEPFHSTLMGLGTEPDATAIPPKTVMFAVSFRLLAIEYLLGIKLSSLVNYATRLPADFWGISEHDLTDFDSFCNKVSATLTGLLQRNIDVRKQKLFELIYSSAGALSVAELADNVGWSSRQINRYFTTYVGISLKAYCTILRFRASLNHIKSGKLYPEQNFADQTHFIKEIKKFSGVIPKELARNANDRFILLLTLPEN
ncbi:helix-turn-helix transcriptional regulator [Spirosoma sp. KCTC 42546]|uniref:helix-turn-helix domain-containing protein n=1 Tax=Spirosoma sp. KCTC 42546 TaxID=2520506 RepID=UPI00115A9F4C|nr:AraC family transcriptional regulator [Spirosoma sp. KCTC 42546]QDK79960.1 helix-turn-helix transcriptional regulator [Spirosoma sp. KCTC 42546]